VKVKERKSDGVAYARKVCAGYGEWRVQPLERRLPNVPARAASHTQSLGSAEVARIAGLWHDLDKYAAHFQQYRSVNAPSA